MKAMSEELLNLFGGSEENMKYYLELRSCLQAMRACGEQTPTFDPRDAVMQKRLEQSEWRPTLREKLPDLATSDRGSHGSRNKQTALEERGEEEEEEWDQQIDSGEDEKRRPTMATERSSSSADKFVCGVQGCSQSFSDLSSYESHYWMCHNYECAVCKRSFVSNFLLDLHIQENHDSYFQILSSRIDMYCCLVESCELKFRTPDLRKDHLVVHHKYPASFSFHQPVKPSKPKSEKVSTNSTPHNAGESKSFVDVAMETENRADQEIPTARQSRKKGHSKKKPKPGLERMEFETDNTPTDGLNQTCTATTVPRGRGGRGRNRVPQTICFGRGSQRAFQSRGRGRHWHQIPQGKDTKVNIEQMDFGDIKDALED